MWWLPDCGGSFVPFLSVRGPCPCSRHFGGGPLAAGQGRRPVGWSGPFRHQLYVRIIALIRHPWTHLRVGQGSTKRSRYSQAPAGVGPQKLTWCLSPRPLLGSGEGHLKSDIRHLGIKVALQFPTNNQDCHVIPKEAGRADSHGSARAHSMCPSSCSRRCGPAYI